MIRKLFACGVLLSFLLSIATVVFWVRSYRGRDVVTFERTARWSIGSAQSRRSSHESEIWIENVYIDFGSETGGWSKGLLPKGVIPYSDHWTVRFDQKMEGPLVQLIKNTPPSRFSGSGTSSVTVLGGNAGWRLTQVRYVAIPDWMLLLATLILPTAYAAGAYVRHRRRRRKDCCKHCGYNLTGNASGICPECGSAVAGVQAKARSE